MIRCSDGIKKLLEKFLNKEVETKYITSSHKYTLDICDDNIEYISSSSKQNIKTDIVDNSIVIKEKNEDWIIVIIPVNIKRQENDLISVNLKTDKEIKVSTFIKDENNKEFWGDIKTISSERKITVPIEKMSSPEWEDSKHTPGNMIQSICIYISGKDIYEVLINNISIHTGRDKSQEIHGKNNIFGLRNGTFLFENKEEYDIEFSTSDNIRLNFQAKEKISNNKRLRLRFDLFDNKSIQLEDILGLYFLIRSSSGIAIDLYTENDKQIKTFFNESSTDIKNILLYKEDLVLFEKDTRISSIVFEFSAKKGEINIYDSHLVYAKNNIKTEDILSNQEDFIITGDEFVLSTDNGYFSLRDGDKGEFSYDKDDNISFRINKPSNHKDPYTLFKFTLFENRKIKLSDWDGIFITFEGKKEFRFRIIATDIKGNEYWSNPVYVNGSSGFSVLKFNDFFIPDWLEKNSQQADEAIAFSILFEGSGDFSLKIDSFDLFVGGEKKDRIFDISSTKDHTLYPFVDLGSHDISDENVHIATENANIKVDTKDKVVLEYIPKNSSEKTFSMVELLTPRILNIPSKQISGIGLFIEKEGDFDLRVITKDENQNEYWSNPLVLKENTLSSLYIPIDDFYRPQWIQEKGPRGDLLKNLAFNLSGLASGKAIIHRILVYTKDYTLYLDSKDIGNMETLFNLKKTSNKMIKNLISSDNIIVNKAKLEDNELKLKILPDKESYLIIRYDLHLAGYTDLSDVSYISSLINTNVSSLLKMVITDTEDRQISTQHRELMENGLAAYEFRKQDFTEGDVSNFNFSMIKNIEIHLNKINNDQRGEAHLVFSSPVFFGKSKTTENKYFILQDFNFFGDNVFKNYWVSAGKEANIDLIPAHREKDLDYPCLKVPFSIFSEDSQNNWIVMKRNDLPISMDISEYEYITFFFKCDTKGLKIRFSITDTDGKISSYTMNRLSEFDRFIKVNIPISKIKGDADIKKIRSYDFYCGLEWNKPPVKGNMFFATYTPIVDETTTHVKEIKTVKARDPELDNLENKIETTRRKIMVSGKLYDLDEIKDLIDKKIEKGKETFSKKDLKMQEIRQNKKWGLSGVAMFIEPTNLCNLACIMCNHGDKSFDRTLGVMKFKDFKRVADEIRERKFNIWEVAPFWLGEPFIHPQITQFIDYISEIRRLPGTIQHFNIHTNGNVLTDEHIESVVNSELDSILFSIDAAKEDTYRGIRVNGSLETVINNIKKLKEARDKKGRKSPAIILQFIVMDQNVDEIMDFINLGKKLGIEKVIYAGRKEDNKYDLPMEENLLFPQIDYDLVFIKSLEPNALTKDQTHREIITNVKKDIVRRPCGSLWRMFSVSWDGNATACCRDDQVDMCVGNVLKDGVENVWYGEELKEIRLAHILGDFDKVPKCNECLNWVKYPISHDEIEEWLESVGEENLIKIYKERFNR